MLGRNGTFRLSARQSWQSPWSDDLAGHEDGPGADVAAVGPGQVVDVTYCEGWDPQARAAVAPISEPQARDRDASGERYAVLLSAQGRPKTLFQADWGHGHLGLFLFDEYERLNKELEYRQTDASH
ncbi:hypothetical protein AB0K18_10570 [Nonomuraea sp. NPDC049421]|uniref:hypothetical protein n=1 Tax=Nonomuraea sp. NPDC049421 TaxID=3155275 RepID=UPI00343D56A9